MVDVELKELIDDANEIRQFIDRSNRPNVKAKFIVLVKEVEEQIAKRKATMKPVDTNQTLKRNYEIKNYAWDQSDKFVKLYLTLSGVENVAPDDVKSSFTNRSLVVSISNVNGNNYEFSMKNLLHDVIPEESSCKVKKDSVIIMLRKKASSQWSYLTQTEQQIKEKQDGKWKGKPEEKKDPGEGLMDVMRQMYETGDDEMKRTIAKAWTESREKQGRGDMM